MRRQIQLGAEAMTGGSHEATGAAEPRSGAILGVVLIVVLAVTTLGSGLIALSGSSSLEVSKAISAAEAFWVAEGGLEYMKALIVKAPTYPLESMGAFNQGTLVGDIDGLPFSVTYQVNVGTNFNYQVVSTGTSGGGTTAQVEMNAWLQSVTKYLNAWNLGGKAPGYPSRFHDLDRLDGDGVGEAYYNGRLNIEGYPTFEIPVLSTADNIMLQLPHRSEDDGTVFRQGLYLNSDMVNFLESSDPNYVDFMGDVRSAAQSGGLLLNGDHEIIFYDNGTLTYEPIVGKGKGKGGGGPGPKTYDFSVGNGAVYVDGDVVVRGEVRGEITLAARDDLVITGDIIYATATAADHSDVAFNKNAITDYLGLIAGDSAVFLETLADINIHASIVVTGGTFGRLRATGKYLGPINLFGSVVQYTGGGNHPQWGGVKNYLYDGRVFSSPPPYFPLNGYTYSGWRQTR